MAPIYGLAATPVAKAKGVKTVMRLGVEPDKMLALILSGRVFLKVVVID